VIPKARQAKGTAGTWFALPKIAFARLKTVSICLYQKIIEKDGNFKLLTSEKYCAGSLRKIPLPGRSPGWKSSVLFTHLR